MVLVGEVRAASALLRAAAVVAVVVLASMVAPAPAASRTMLKGFWGPTQRGGVSQFPTYRDLGVNVFQAQLYWANAAPQRPSHPRDPLDPAYRWPVDIDYAIAQAKLYNMQVLLMIITTPPWANGGKGQLWAPRNMGDFANFAFAASKRYPSVKLWMVWGEPSRAPNWKPETPQGSAAANAGKPLTKKQAKAPRAYASMLDQTYGSLKQASKQNLVIGGNTFSWGDIRPIPWVKNMRFGKKNKRPRLDFYGHNPFTPRRPDLKNPPNPSWCKAGCADFSALKRFGKIVDKNLGRKKHKHLPLFLSEFTIPTAPHDSEFPYFVSAPTQANWITAGFKVARAVGAYAFGWVHLYDDPPDPYVRTSQGGLIYSNGKKKPGYKAFKAG